MNVCMYVCMYKALYVHIKLFQPMNAFIPIMQTPVNLTHHLMQKPIVQNGAIHTTHTLIHSSLHTYLHQGGAVSAMPPVGGCVCSNGLASSAADTDTDTPADIASEIETSHTYTYTLTYSYTYMHMCIDTSIHTYIHLCTYNQFVHACIHT